MQKLLIFQFLVMILLMFQAIAEGFSLFQPLILDNEENTQTKRIVWMRRRHNVPYIDAIKQEPPGLKDYMASTRFFHVYGKRGQNSQTFPSSKLQQTSQIFSKYTNIKQFHRRFETDQFLKSKVLDFIKAVKGDPNHESRVSQS